MHKFLLCLFLCFSLVSHSQVLSAIALATATPCYDTNFGQIIVNTTGGTAPYSYRIQPDPTYQSNNIFNNLSAGTYTIEVKDANNNFAITAATIENPSPIIASAVITKPIDCINNATITLTITSGTAPYTYSKDGYTFVESNVFDNLEAGIYSTSVKDANGCIFNTNPVVISPLVPLIATFTATHILCSGNNDGSITINATRGQSPYTYSINNSPYQPQNYFSNLTAGTYNVIAQDANGCLVSNIAIITQPYLLTTTATVIDQTTTANTTGGTPPYIYSLDGTIYSNDNTFSNATPGSYTIWTKDANNCIVSLDFVINAPAPLINDSNTITLSLVSGQTLADIIVEGENIKWYSTPGISTGKIKQANKKVGETPLPLTTVLVDNTTYYASQTINGIESTQRLAVTVQLNALATPEFVLANFKSYPNPVKNSLMIQNTSIIDEIVLYSITGKTVLTKKIKNLRSEVDLSALSSGIYFLKVKSEEKEKTVRIIKE